jgi:hypothetical protein
MAVANHTYKVELRVYGRDVIPDRITERTHLTPCTVRAAGSRTGPKTHQDAVWGFNGGAPDEFLEWSSLEDGLSFVLNAVGRAREDVRSCVGGASIIWWCGHFQSSFDGGPTLSPEILQRLSEFGVPLFVDNYFSHSQQ